MIPVINQRPSRRSAGGGGAPPSPLLDEAEAYWKASAYDGVSASLADLSGHGHDAQLGSTAGADTNDPLFLADGPYVYLPGSAGNHANVVGTASLGNALGITDDIDIRVQMASDWTPSASMVLLSKWTGAGAPRSYAMVLKTTGALSLFMTVDGTGAIEAVSTATVAFADGDIRWVRAARTRSTGAVTFYTSIDGVQWDQLGDVFVLGAGEAIADTTAGVFIGVNADNTAPSTGKFYRAQVYASTNGTDKRLDIDFTDLAAYNATRTSLTAVTGQTVTLNRSTIGRKLVVVDRPLFLFGTDDFMEVADHVNLNFDETESFTVLIASRRYTNAGFGIPIGKDAAISGVAPGWSLYEPGIGTDANVFISDTVTEVPDGGIATVGNVEIRTLRVDRSAQGIESFVDGVGSGSPGNIAAVGTPTNSLPVRIGCSSGATPATFLNFEFAGAAIFRRALTVAEVVQAGTELLA